MQYLISLFIILIVAACWRQAFAEPAQIHMPLQRASVSLADADGVPSVIVSAMTFGYQIPEGARGVMGEVVRRHCASLSEDERRMVPECVILKEYDLRRAGEVDARAALFVEGAWRERARAWPPVLSKDPGEIVEAYANHGDLRIGSVARWSDRIYIGYDSVA